MKILVTGGNGFIGQHVTEQLIENGHTTVIFDRKTKSHQHNSSYNIENIYGSITDATAVHEAMSEVDAFIHLAGVLGTQETIKNPVPAAYTNTIGGLNMLEAAAFHKVPGVNITVGNWWMNNTYSITKNMTERLAHMYNKERGTSISNIRIVNTYGPGQSVAAPFGHSSVRKIMPSFICRALTGRDIEVYGDGSQVSDIIYVNDVARIIVSELDSVLKNGPRKHCLEIGPKEQMTVYEIAVLVRDIVAEFGLKKVGIKYLEMRPGENANALLSAVGAIKLNLAMKELCVDEEHPMLLSNAMGSMVRALCNVVSADLTTLQHLNIDTDNLTPPDVGIRNTVQYYLKSKGAAWNDYEQDNI